jgi:hypothetical protein
MPSRNFQTPWARRVLRPVSCNEHLPPPTTSLYQRFATNNTTNLGLYRGQHWGSADCAAVYYECTTCLSDQNNKPGLGTNLLHGFPAENGSYAASVLLRVGAYERAFQWPSIVEGTDRDGPDLRLPPSTRIKPGDKRAAVLQRSVPDSLGLRTWSAKNPSQLIERLWTDTHFDSGFPKIESELHVAHITARLPILVIMGAERQLPKVTKEDSASELAYIVTMVQVKWPAPSACSWSSWPRRLWQLGS